MVPMGLTSDITAAAFVAYIKCPTKSYLILHGERPSELLVAEMRERISTAYKMRCKQQVESALTGAVPIDFSRLTEKPTHEASALLVDCETAFYVRERSLVLAEK